MKNTTFTAVVDYSTSNGMKHWQESTQKLQDELNDGDAGTLRRFLDLISTRAKIAGWKPICNINGKNILEEYDTLSY